LPLFPPPINEAGGLIECEYADPAVGERHAFKVHVCHFDPVSFNYVGAGPKIPTVETNVAQTFAALAAVWAAYYPTSWTLRLVSCWYNSGGQLTRLPTAPVTTPVVGSNGNPNAFGSSVRRIFHVESTIGRKRKFYVQQLLGVAIDTDVPVSGIAGGIDALDRAFMGYIASAGSGVCAPDGFPFAPVGSVRVWWSRPLEAAVMGGGGGTGLVGNCLTFPNLTVICNPSTDVVTLATPSGEFVFDATGITLPGGHRLEVA